MGKVVERETNAWTPDCFLTPDGFNVSLETMCQIQFTNQKMLFVLLGETGISELYS